MPEVEQLEGAAGKPVPVTEAQEFQHALGVAHTFRSRDSGKALLAIFVNYAVMGTCIFLSEQVHGTQFSSAAKWAAYAAACLVISSRMRAFENLVHEASHFNLFKTPSMHYTLQFLYAFPVLRVLEDYRRSHLIHHQHLGDAAKDPDLIRIYELGLDNVTEDPVYYLFAMPFSGYIHWEYLTTTFVDFWTSRAAWPSKAVFWGAVLAGSYFNETMASRMALYYAVPFFLVLPVFRYWAEMSEHLGMDMTGKFGNSRSNLGFTHRWFIHPHNDGFHAVHHLHAQVPFHQLPQAHEALMSQNEAFRTKNVLSTGVVETLRQVVSTKIVTKGTPEKQAHGGSPAQKSWFAPLEAWRKLVSVRSQRQTEGPTATPYMARM
ncbi:fatty acid desaturase-domain-containing protein [Truncatella angustata]|uniref:Fatty acid desaturase-domain-containing protein n=1 Tax=Truncatella angustata TaxID=152316 RepID=A0A9P8RJE6_9PEZI|nr:fatty acid desaturase-domain-containing protein [Truncatella angustata]KAH6645403.1 fatty acid desaturase-domain-containing protein [Truncatella angustata]